MIISKVPSLNLKAVLQKTGISADSLRAWERRYGLPLPERTPGGHRLYSQYDVEIIKWLMAKQEDGVSISRAVEMWKEQINSNLDPLDGLPPSSHFPLQATPIPNAETTLDLLRNRWITACLTFNEVAADQNLNQAFSIFPVETVCTDVLQKGLAEIGELWYENRATVQQEHFASGLAVRKLEALLNASPAPWREQTVIVGCPTNEWHAFSPLLLSLFLRRRGLNIIHLGVNVPNDQFPTTASTVRADLVILASQTLITAATLQQSALLMTSQDIPVAFGGRIFNTQPSIIGNIPAYFLGNTLIQSIDEVERLLGTTEPPPRTNPPSQEYLNAYHSFTAKRPHIELTLQQTIKLSTISLENLTSGIDHLGDLITAALQLGDMNYVSGEMEWLKSLIKTHEQSTHELVNFMTAYRESINKHLHGSCQPIFEWFSKEMERLQA